MLSLQSHVSMSPVIKAGKRPFRTAEDYSPADCFTYDIASREVAYWVLSSQRDGAEHDEDQDEVGEDLMVDQLMAEYAKTRAESKTKQKKQRVREAQRERTYSESGFVTQL